MTASIIPHIDEKRIIAHIEKAELKTSGEIRVHIENDIDKNVLDDAANMFEQLNMHLTKNRNGVLLYIVDKAKQFAIIGDVGINKVVEDDFWTKEKNILLNHFKQAEFTKGITETIDNIGSRLAKHFPPEDGTEGELPNEISYGQ